MNVSGMFLRSVLIRGPVPGGGLRVTTKDISLSVLVRSLNSLKLSESIQYCSIKKLEANCELSRQKLDKSQPLDKCVAYILKEDIQVPEVTLMLNKAPYVLTYSRSLMNIPDDVKLKRWSPIDNEMIRNNMDTLVAGIKRRKSKDAVIKSIFAPSKLRWHKEKTNIVGCFLGQGLQDLRLPCEIFRRADTLYNEELELGQKIVFTESDDRQIIDYMENNAATDMTPYSTLSKMLGYTRGSIQKRYTLVLKTGGDKVVKGRYTDNENREIMNTIFKQNENALKHYYTLSDQLWTELGIQLNRRPRNIFDHWEAFIKPRIIQFENKIEIKDIRPVLIDYFLEKGIMFRSETNWGEIVKDKRFKGLTPHFLQRSYCNMVGAFKKANPGVEVDDITSEALHQYLDQRVRKPKINKPIRRLIEDYVNIKNST